MMDVYLGTFEEFLADNPVIDPSVQPMVEKLYKDMEYQILIDLLYCLY